MTVTKPKELGTELLNQATDLARQAAALKAQLVCLRRQHSSLLAQREEKLIEGVDVLADVGRLYLIIEGLPNRIIQLEQAARRIATDFVEQCNAENIQRANKAYQENRDALRPAVQEFAATLARVRESMRLSACNGDSFASGANERVAVVELELNDGPLPRVTYPIRPLPVLDLAAVGRGEFLSALENWTRHLR